MATEPSSSPPARKGASRQTVALAIGGVLGLIVVVGALYATLSAGDSDAAPPTTVPGPTTTITIPDELKDPIVIPEGDYTAFCTQIDQQAKELKGDITPGQLRSLFLTLDFEALRQSAPAGLQPSIVELRDDKDAVVLALEQVSSLTDLTAADLPKGFPRALATVVQSTAKNCELGD
ncbi:MAG: hypothetical protein U0P45_11100 [Acidimicrobiales bacterium]